ncbi:hypothetical protein BR141012304_10577 [Brucella inopinata]|nr:hypothetical protein BR141012304_10577 [Brucella inopinata]
MFLGFGLGGIDGCVARLLFGDLVSFAQVVFHNGQHLGFQFRQVFRLEVTRFLGGNFGKLDDRIDHRLEALVAEHDGAEHDIFGQFLRFRFDHQNRFRRTGNHQIELGFRHFIDIRVQDIFAIDITDARAADRPHERHARNGEGSRCRNHRQDVRVVFQIVLENGNDDLRVVLVAVNEKRADRTVDQARNEGFVFARTAFTLEIAAGNLAGCVGLFLIIDGQRKKVLARLRFLGRNDSCENGGFAIGGKNSAVSLTGNFAGFECERTSAPFDFNFMGIEHILSSCGNAVKMR